MVYAKICQVMKNIEFGNNQTFIESATPGQTINIGARLSDPLGFHGDKEVDDVVHFGNTFSPLIGVFDRQDLWPRSLEEQVKNGIVILEDHYQDAKKLMEDINTLATRLVQDDKLYDDLGFCTEYFNLAQRGYEMLRDHQSEFGFTSTQEAPVSLERAGLVTTRLSIGADTNAQVSNEVKVVTKRTHLIGDPPTDLTVTVKWRDKNDIGRINGDTICLADFINPASGASASAFLLSAHNRGSLPQTVNHRSISVTQQGVLFIKDAFEKLGVKKVTFYSVGKASELNDHYYLSGDRTVGDAGHVLRHFLPKWYSQ